MPMGDVCVSAPGRICLFGEHQDYLMLPVIPCAISLRISVSGRRRNDSRIFVHLPNIGSRESFSLEDAGYVRERDYFRSSVTVLRRHGFSFSSGLDCTVSGTIPINAGTSSSSALVVCWVRFLALMSDQCRELSASECARFAYEAEVLEFSEPGGMMDQYSTAFGGVTFIDFSPECKVTRLNPRLGAFVLGDSGEPKDTKKVLARVKDRVLDISRRLIAGFPHFSLLNATLDSILQLKSALSPEDYLLLEATVRNHGITLDARSVLESRTPDDARLGSLLNDHQAVLRDVLKISTPKIDAMIDAALSAGALGGKINGSGGGGCMFVYAPDFFHNVAGAIEKAGGKAFVITADEGSRIEQGLAV